MRSAFYITSVLLIGLSCGSDQKEFHGDVLTDVPQNDDNELLIALEQENLHSEKTIGEIIYRFKSISAIQYLKRIGAVIERDDIEDLKHESVLFLEFETGNGFKDIYESNSINYSQDEAIRYLIGEIQNDVIIEQNGKEFSPNGCQFEGKSGKENKIRVMFFFSGLNNSDEFSVQYYDRLFGKGLIKTKNSKTLQIS